jgi:hypothetical protein
MANERKAPIKIQLCCIYCREFFYWDSSFYIATCPNCSKHYRWKHEREDFIKANVPISSKNLIERMIKGER